MLIIIAHWTVRPDMLDDFMTDMRGNVVEAQSEAGSLEYQPAMKDRAAGEVLVVERWQDHATFAAHREAPHVKALGAKWREHLSGNVEVYEVADQPG